MSNHEKDESRKKLPFEKEALIIKGKIEDLKTQQAEQQKRDEEYKNTQLRFNRLLTWFTGGLLVTSLGANGISFYMAVAAKESADAARSAAGAAESANRINRESLESVQRAFVTFQKMNYTRVVDRDGHAYWDTFENTGTTPAMEVRKMFAVSELEEEPNNAEFIGPVSRAEFSVTTIGPKSLQDSGKSKQPDSLIFGNLARAVPLSRRYTFTNKRKPFFWGWVAYRDVFRETPLHITEFCYQLTEVLVRDEPGHGSIFTFESCNSHNCVDKYCEDYQSLSTAMPN